VPVVQGEATVTAWCRARRHGWVARQPQSGDADGGVLRLQGEHSGCAGAGLLVDGVATSAVRIESMPRMHSQGWLVGSEPIGAASPVPRSRRWAVCSTVASSALIRTRVSGELVARTASRWRPRSVQRRAARHPHVAEQRQGAPTPPRRIRWTPRRTARAAPRWQSSPRVVARQRLGTDHGENCGTRRVSQLNSPGTSPLARRAPAHRPVGTQPMNRPTSEPAPAEVLL
jgi:hypothetical protein